MRRLRDWFRFHGWRNVYWREDAHMARCWHIAPVYIDEDGFRFCVDCGAPLTQRNYPALRTFGSSNVTIKTTVRR